MNLIKSNKCEFSQNQLVISEDCSHNEWVNIGKQLKYIEGSVQFWIGDWARFGARYENSNNVKKEVYDQLEEITGFDRRTLREYKQVAEKVGARAPSLPYSHHREVVNLSPDKQKHFLDKAEQEKLTVRELKNEILQDKKANFVKPEGIKGKYEIIYLDPPWQYDKDESYFGQDVEKHYPTMNFYELSKLPINELAEENCVLYMWTTAPKLNWALDLLKEWRLGYKTCLIWDKVKHNMGFYASIRHEILIIAGQGQAAPTDKSYANQTDSVYVEERTTHSKKPGYYYGMIEKMHPTKLKRLEMFAREEREGWQSWGNQV